MSVYYKIALSNGYAEGSGYHLLYSFHWSLVICQRKALRGDTGAVQVAAQCKKQQWSLRKYQHFYKGWHPSTNERCIACVFGVLAVQAYRRFNIKLWWAGFTGTPHFRKQGGGREKKTHSLQTCYFCLLLTWVNGKRLSSCITVSFFMSCVSPEPCVLLRGSAGRSSITTARAVQDVIKKQKKKHQSPASIPALVVVWHVF